MGRKWIDNQIREGIDIMLEEHGGEFQREEDEEETVETWHAAGMRVVDDPNEMFITEDEFDLSIFAT